MAEYVMEVEACVTTQVTGRLGNAIVWYRGANYCATIYEGEGSVCVFRNGVICPWPNVPYPVARHIFRVRDKLRNAGG